MTFAEKDAGNEMSATDSTLRQESSASKEIQVHRLAYPQLHTLYQDDSNQQVTTLGQIIDLYKKGYGAWPWYEQHSTTEIFEKMHRELMPGTDVLIRDKPFLFVAEQGEKVIGFTWGFVTDDVFGFQTWFVDNADTVDEQNKIAEEIKKARAARKQFDHRVTVIAEMVVDPHHSKGGIVFAQLAQAMAKYQVEEVGVPQAVGWTVSPKEESTERIPRMVQLTELFGWKPLYTLGELPTNHAMLAQVMAGDLHETVRILNQYPPEQIFRGLLALRREKKKVNAHEK